MIKKITGIVLAGIILTLFTFNAGTGAWFTDSRVSNNNIFQTGILKIEETGPLTAGMNVDNIYPGWNSGEGPKAINIVNSGTVDFNYSVSVESLTGNLLYDGLTPLQVNINETGFIDINKVKNIGLGGINAKDTGSFTIRLRLPENADNSYSEKTAAFNFVFDATQKVSSTEPGTGNSNDGDSGTGGSNDEDSNSGGSNLGSAYNSNKNQYYASIPEAVNDASAGDIIKVSAGLHSGDISLDKPIILEGPNKGIHPQYSQRKPEAIIKGTIILNSSNITIDGFEITNPGTGNYFGIRGNKAGIDYSDITIKYNNFHDLGSNAIRYGSGYGGGTGTQNWNISSNKISKVTGEGIAALRLQNIAGLAIENNYIRHTENVLARTGISMSGVTRALIENNDISLGGVEIDKAQCLVKIDVTAYSLLKVCDSIIRNNKFSYACEGISTIGIGSLEKLFVENNNFDNISTNIKLEPSPKSDGSGGTNIVGITGNTFTDSINGLSFTASTPYRNIKVNENRFSNISNYYILATAEAAFASGNIDASRNWWGTSIESEIKDKMKGYISFSPWY
jgi:hypothetical protein